ncbi:hypothetical protein L1887_09819 [Cichorium endivia]|nr:hypothetical protein L1887_09819 [Cichorium endivia]
MGWSIPAASTATSDADGIRSTTLKNETTSLIRDSFLIRNFHILRDLQNYGISHCWLSSYGPQERAQVCS